MRPTTGAVAVIFSLTSPTRMLWAQTPPIVERPVGGALAFAPGATCVEQTRLESEVQAWLGRDRIPSDVRVDVRGDDHDPRVAVFWISRAGTTHERRFDRLPESCDDATAVLGLGIALAVDANILAGVFAPSPKVAPPKRFVAIEAAAGFQVLPGASVGVAAGMEYGLLDWLSGRLDVGTQFSWGNTIDGTSGVFDVEVGAVAPQACAGGDVTDGVRLELCSGAGFGVVHAQGRRFVTSRSATRPWVVAQGGLRLRVLAGVSWVLDVEGVFPIYVPDFQAENTMGMSLQTPRNLAGALVSAGPVLLF